MAFKVIAGFIDYCTKHIVITYRRQDVTVCSFLILKEFWILSLVCVSGLVCVISFPQLSDCYRYILLELTCLQCCVDLIM